MYGPPIGLGIGRGGGSQLMLQAGGRGEDCLLFSGHEPIYFIENKEKTLRVSYDRDTLYHRERILETSTLSCNEEEEESPNLPQDEGTPPLFWVLSE